MPPPPSATPTPHTRSTAPVDTPSRLAPSEFKGEGVLFPAVVIGIGQLGMRVLQQLRDSLVQRFGSMSQLPNVRLMLLDTDPEVVEGGDARHGEQCAVRSGCPAGAAESAQPLPQTARRPAED